MLFFRECGKYHAVDSVHDKAQYVQCVAPCVLSLFGFILPATLQQHDD